METQAHHSDARRRGLADDGFGFARGFLNPVQVETLHTLIQEAPAESWERRRSGVPFAIRNLHLVLPHVRETVAFLGLVELASTLLGTKADPVSATLFDKPTGADWSVPAHQDVIHLLSGDERPAGFRNWTSRSGILYARLPDELLRHMVALRVFLDPQDDSVALHVVPGSHLQSHPTDEVYDTDPRRLVGCGGEAGDVLAIRPLLIHRSGPVGAQQRRVLHLVFSGMRLPPGLSWTWV